MNFTKYIFLGFFLFLRFNYFSQCNNITVDAGTNLSICIGQSTQIVGNPTADFTGPDPKRTRTTENIFLL